MSWARWLNTRHVQGFSHVSADDEATFLRVNCHWTVIIGETYMKHQNEQNDPEFHEEPKLLPTRWGRCSTIQISNDTPVHKSGKEAVQFWMSCLLISFWHFPKLDTSLLQGIHNDWSSTKYEAWTTDVSSWNADLIAAAPSHPKTITDLRGSTSP